VAGLPFFHLNLRRNPFGELTVAERTRLAMVECAVALQHLKSPRSVIQVVGERGFGKTTHLLALAAQYEKSTYVHIRKGNV
jgi:flagellar biosynthesis GTPase FlhF